MNKRTGLMLFALIFLAGVLIGCNALAPVKILLSTETHTPTALPPTETPSQQPSATLTPTIIPTETKRAWKPTASHSVTLCPSFTPTATPTPISPEAQAFKEFLFSDCIPVEESLPEGFEVPWNLLMGGQIIDLENGVTIETFLSHENIPEDTDLNPYYIHVSPDGKWVAYQDTSHKKLYVEPIPTLLTKNEAVDRIVIEKDVRFHLKRWVDNETVFYIYRESMDTYVFPTVFHNVFSGKEYEFLLQDLPDYMSHHWGGGCYCDALSGWGSDP